MIEHGPQSADRLSIDIAWLYCATLTHNGYSDWRIPLPREISSVGWHDNDVIWAPMNDHVLHTVVPVRDIK